MTEKRRPNVEKLELNRETVEYLSESEAEGAVGGARPTYDGLDLRCHQPSAAPRKCSIGCEGTVRCPSAVVANNCPGAAI